MTKNNDREALQWIALRYVLEELPAEERADFEARMMDDQEAREAVADAVEFAMATKVAESDESASPMEPVSVTRSRSLIWYSGLSLLVTSAILLIAVSLQNGQPNDKDPIEGESIAALADAWHDASADLIDLETTETVSEITASELDDVVEQVVDDLETPDWMQMAVAGLAEDGELETEEDAS